MQSWPGQSDSGLWSIYSLVWSGPDLTWPLFWVSPDSVIYRLEHIWHYINIFKIYRQKNIWVEDHRWSVLPMNISKLFSVVLFYCNFFYQFCIFVLFLKKSVTVRLSFNSFFKFLTTKFVDFFFFNSLIIPKGRHSLTLLLTQKIRLCFIFATVLILSLCLVLFSFCRRNFFCCVLLRTLWLVCRCLAANSVYHHQLNRARILGQPWEIVLFLQNGPTSKNKISLKIPSGSERRIWNVCCVLPVLSLTLVKWVWERSELCRVTEVNALVWLADPGGQRHRVNFNISQLIWFTLLKL